MQTQEDILSKFNFKCNIPLRWKDIDQFGHVNNSLYPTYFEMARYEYCKDVCSWDWKVDQFILASIHVEYLRPIFFPDETYCYVRISQIGTKSFQFDYAITTIRNGVEKLMTTGYSKMVMFDLATNKTIEMVDRIKTLIVNFEKEIEL